MLAFDSNILIYHLEGNKKFGERSRRVFLEIEKVGGVCSSVVITESLYGTILSLDQLGPLLSPSITVLPVDNTTAELAGQLKTKYGLKNIDAIHIATALLSRAKTFITNDLYLAKKSQKILPTKTLTDY
jgi:predicted nucleic acid-binding protein